MSGELLVGGGGSNRLHFVSVFLFEFVFLFSLVFVFDLVYLMCLERFLHEVVARIDCTSGPSDIQVSANLMRQGQITSKHPKKYKYFPLSLFIVGSW